MSLAMPQNQHTQKKSTAFLYAKNENVETVT